MGGKQNKLPICEKANIWLHLVTNITFLNNLTLISIVKLLK